MDSPVNDTESDSDSDIDSDNDNDSDGVIVFPAKMTSSPEKLLWPNTAEQPDPTEDQTSTACEPNIEELDEWARLKGSNREETTSQETKDSSTLLLSNGTKELTTQFQIEGGGVVQGVTKLISTFFSFCDLKLKLCKLS